MVIMNYLGRLYVLRDTILIFLQRNWWRFLLTAVMLELVNKTLIPELPDIPTVYSKKEIDWNFDKLDVSNISLDFNYSPFGNQITITGYEAENIDVKAVFSFDTEADKWMFKDLIDMNASRVQLKFESGWMGWLFEKTQPFINSSHDLIRRHFSEQIASEVDELNQRPKL